MAISTCFFPGAAFPNLTNQYTKIGSPLFSSSSSRSSIVNLRISLSTPPTSSISLRQPSLIPYCSFTNDSFAGGENNNGGRGGGGDGYGNGGEGGGTDGESKKEIMMLLANSERTLESLPKDLAAAIEDGRIPLAVISRF